MKKFRRASNVAPEPDDNSRVIRYEFSNSSVARDNHTINTAGWDLTNFNVNPVFLWAHDGNALPIGRVVDVGVSGDRLMGNVEYISRELYPFADTVYQLVRGKFLNATSVSWQASEYRFSQDKGRAGGIDFIKQELLEVSQVPVPALPSALVAARGAGIDTQPMHEWLERALDTGGLAMVSRSHLEELRKAAKMPSVGKRATAAMSDAPKRGLYDVCYLAEVVSALGYVTAMSQWEESYEADDSTVPAQLLAALQLLGAALIAMTQEEVAEMLADLVPEDESTLLDGGALDIYVAAATTPSQRLLRGLEAVARRRGLPPATLPARALAPAEVEAEAVALRLRMAKARRFRALALITD